MSKFASLQYFETSSATEFWRSNFDISRINVNYIAAGDHKAIVDVKLERGYIQNQDFNLQILQEG